MSAQAKYVTDIASRDQLRNRRKRAVRSTTVNLKRVPKRELKVLSDLYPETGYWKPRTRGDCEKVERPCPFVSCRHHLYLDVVGKRSIKFNFPDLEPDELVETCSLDVAEADGEPLEVVGELMNMTRERARQVETSALAKVEQRKQLEPHVDDNEQRRRMRSLSETP